MLILGSKSPRRIALLNMLNIPFKAIPSTGEEIIEGNSQPFEVAELLAIKKAEEVYLNNPKDIILAADTIVVCENKILGKPNNLSEAHQMLNLLSGKKHKVYTGVAIISHNNTTSFTEETIVEFYPLEKSEIENYINNNAPFDKAGGYGIQDRGALFIKKIIGDYYNVMGLPISKVYRSLSSFLPTD